MCILCISGNRDTPWFEGFSSDSGTPTNNLALTSLCNKGISTQSVFNVTVHWWNHIWKHILVTYLTLCIRPWWCCICSVYLHLLMPLPSSLLRVAETCVQSRPSLSIPPYVIHTYLSPSPPIPTSRLQSPKLSRWPFLQCPSHQLLFSSIHFAVLVKLTFLVYSSHPVICFHRIILLIISLWWHQNS